MSLSVTLSKAIDDVVNTFINRVVKEYNLDRECLRDLWEKDEGSSSVKHDCKRKNVLTEIDTKDVSEERLMKSTKAELSALCKAKGIKCSGRKADLIARLVGKELKSKPVPKKSKKASQPLKVVKKLTAHVPSIPIRRNRFNNMEHPETSFVFDKKTERVIGKQNDNGNIDNLVASDIELCKKFKFY